MMTAKQIAARALAIHRSLKTGELLERDEHSPGVQAVVERVRRLRHEPPTKLSDARAIRGRGGSGCQRVAVD